MRGGDDLEAKIRKGIANSDALTVLITRNSIKSAWVRKEIKFASELETDISHPRIVPLVLDSCAVPKALKGRLYVKIKRNDLNLSEIVKAIYDNSFILRVSMNDELQFDRESFVRDLGEFLMNGDSRMAIKVVIENDDFNGKIRAILRESLSHREVNRGTVNFISRMYEESTIAMPAFWVSLAAILEQLVNDLVQLSGRSLGTVRETANSIESILEYSFNALAFHLSGAINPDKAESNGHRGIARFFERNNMQDRRELILKRLRLNGNDRLYAIDLVPKDEFLFTRVYAPLDAQDHMYLQFGEKVEASVVGPHWYDEYLPQIVARELLVKSLFSGVRLQTSGNQIGLHMDNYVKAGLA